MDFEIDDERFILEAQAREWIGEQLSLEILQVKHWTCRRLQSVIIHHFG